MRLSMHLMVGIFVSTLFYQIGQDAAYARDNFALLYYGLMFVMYSAYSATLITCDYKTSISYYLTYYF